ncbi:YlbG family protein [Fructobacillus broussonetiae]|uniref:YlbG family protein n=1 Tax=Fructobacillus broussonetiae TaxID=2713173 RepID=UPI001EE58B8C|nr:YlbG family protein [Fructobacillus broussonetiae]
MFKMKERRALYVFMRGLKQVEQLKKFGDIAYISNKMNYVALYVDEDRVDELVPKLKKYRFVKTVKPSARPDIDPDLGDVHDNVFFEAYDKEVAGEGTLDEEIEKAQHRINQTKDGDVDFDIDLALEEEADAKGAADDEAANGKPDLKSGDTESKDASDEAANGKLDLKAGDTESKDASDEAANGKPDLKAGDAESKDASVEASTEKPAKNGEDA